MDVTLAAYVLWSVFRFVGLGCQVEEIVVCIEEVKTFSYVIKSCGVLKWFDTLLSEDLVFTRFTSRWTVTFLRWGRLVENRISKSFLVILLPKKISREVFMLLLELIRVIFRGVLVWWRTVTCSAICNLQIGVFDEWSYLSFRVALVFRMVAIETLMRVGLSASTRQSAFILSWTSHNSWVLQRVLFSACFASCRLFLTKIIAVTSVWAPTSRFISSFRRFFQHHWSISSFFSGLDWTNHLKLSRHTTWHGISISWRDKRERHFSLSNFRIIRQRHRISIWFRIEWKKPFNSSKNLTERFMILLHVEILPF